MTMTSSSEEYTPPPFALPTSAARPKTAGVRILAPGGEIGFVPEEQLDAAVAAGAIVLTPEKMREMRQAIFMEHNLFQSKQRKPAKPRHKQKSLWKGAKK